MSNSTPFSLFMKHVWSTTNRKEIISNAIHSAMRNPDLTDMVNFYIYVFHKSSFNMNQLWGNPNNQLISMLIKQNQRRYYTPFGEIVGDPIMSIIDNIDFYWASGNYNQDVVDCMMYKHDYESTFTHFDTKKNLWYSRMCANQHPDIVEIIQDKIEAYENFEQFRTIDYDLGCLAMNPTATKMFLDLGILERATALSEKSRQRVWKYFFKNPHPAAIRYMKENMNWVNLNSLASNPNTDAVDMIVDYDEPIDLNILVANPAAIHIVEDNIEYISFEALAQNPHPRAIAMLYDKFNPYTLYDLSASFKLNYINPYYHAYVDLD